MSKENEDDRSELLPPPRLHPHGELHPVTEFSFDDQPRPSREETYDEWERVESTPIEDEPILTDELTEEAESIALEHEEVLELLGDRYVTIGASLRLKRREDDTPTLVVVAYNYDDDRTIEAVLEYDDDELDVTDVEQLSYQPAPVDEELDRAIQLATEDEWLSKRLTKKLEGSALRVSSNDVDDPRRGHRLFDVRFRRPNERLPRYRALVDLSAEEVVETGAVGDPDDGCGCQDREEGSHHG